mmetsp:Transcript_15231/g.38744  ORF Transcript_15231/g.38744 Transcript_15231/m.38744 type:complete len:257 (+) Transcript_15231:153-923(+)|eukprot:jgi/Tetstr1/429333/TSEL_019251.t1
MDDKIEQYLLLAKGTRGRGAADLIQRATAEPGLYAFGELLEVESVQELAGTELSGWLDLLKLFAYGVWKDYTGDPSGFPPLDEAQKLKLRQLTIVSIAEGMKVVPYGHLMAQVDISNVRELEDLLINECFYSHLIKGKLDQCERCLHVHHVRGRDVRPEQLDSVIGALGEWLSTSEGLLGELEAKVAFAAEQTSEARAHKAAVEGRVEEAKAAIKAEMEARAGGSGLHEGMEETGVLPHLDFMEHDRGASRPKRRR